MSMYTHAECRLLQCYIRELNFMRLKKNTQEDFNFPFAFIDLSHENTVATWPSSLL